LAWLLRWPYRHLPEGIACEAHLDDGTCLVVSNQSMRDKQTAALRNEAASLAMDGPLSGHWPESAVCSLIQAYIQPAGVRDLA